MILLALLVCAAAMADVDITPENFEDPNFREYLLNLDAGKNGILTDEEIDKIEVIQVDYSSIRSLKGIKLFKKLQELSCVGNSIQELDVSGLKELKHLAAFDNKISTLNLSGCSSLKELFVSGNSLSSVDISSCTKLEVLNVAANNLSTINISKCAASLLYLDVCENNMTSVNLSGCKQLAALWCYGNKISSLDITPAPELRKAFRSGEKEEEETYIRYYNPDGPEYFFATGLAVNRTTTILANTVSFSANGGSGSMDSLAEPNDKAFTLPANSFTRSGWKFTSWNTSKDGTGTSYTDKASVTLKNQDLTLYSQWEKELEQEQQPEQQPEQQQEQQQAEQEIIEQVKLKKIKGIKLKAEKKKIKITWKKLSKKDLKKVKKIQIQVSTDPDFQNILLDKFISAKKSSYTVKKLTRNTKYYIRIRAYTEKDGVRNVSQWIKKSKKTKKK